ncbi:MAG: T9SS type A sorting domain-containing protein, partial [Bacteroidales bacterium]|nr:T9SS type A sorting domain-containing protein [Bacteroidales bacterium]
NPVPVPTISMTPNNNICFGTEVTYTTESGMSAYGWNIPGVSADYTIISGGTSSDNIVKLVWNNMPSGDSPSVSISYTSAVGCLANTPATQTVVLPTKGTNLSGNNETAVCYVNGSKDVHFYNSTTNNYLGSINAIGVDLGLVTMKTYVGSPSHMEDCANPDNPSHWTAYMGRRWEMSSAAYPNSANFPTNATITLPFINDELAALNTYASTVTTVNDLDDNAVLADIALTKVSNGVSDGNASLSDCSGTRIAIEQSGIAASPTGITANKLAFEVEQFSEMFLHKKRDDGSPLPITLSSFSAECNDNNEVILSWSTASEINNDYFEIQRSTQGLAWEVIATVQGAGFSNIILDYDYLDKEKPNTTTYYRLRQIDYDGSSKLSDIIQIRCENNMEKPVISVYPNPFTSSFNIEFENWDLNFAEIELLDITSRTIKKWNLENTLPNFIYEVNLSNLNPAMYMLKIKTSEGVVMKKIEKK